MPNDNISNANRGQKRSEEFSKINSLNQKGRIKSDAEKKKLGLASKNTVFINKDGRNKK